jgi:signal peptidase I
MEPNFYNYEYLVIDELSYHLHDPNRGDVVVLHNPNDEAQFFIKRVIGLPGETVDVKDHHVYINDTKLDESSYLAESVETWGNQHVTLGENMYYVMGDNRSESLDSRVFGPVNKDEFIGRTWVRAWPLTRMTHFSTIDYNL